MQSTQTNKPTPPPVFIPLLYTARQKPIADALCRMLTTYGFEVRTTEKLRAEVLRDACRAGMIIVLDELGNDPLEEQLIAATKERQLTILHASQSAPSVSYPHVHAKLHEGFEKDPEPALIHRLFVSGVCTCPEAFATERCMPDDLGQLITKAAGAHLQNDEDMYALAQELRQELQTRWGVKNLGVLVTDSMILPLRAGVVAAAVAYAGFKGVKDLRGQPDIYGKPLEVTLVNVADSLATAAALCMGEGNNKTPLCLIQNAPAEFTDKTNETEIKYPVENDLYTPLFQAVGFIKKGDKKA